MRTIDAIEIARKSIGKEQMVFDWDKAATLIKEKGAKVARAGLRDDWEYTGGDIYFRGSILTNRGTFLASTWAVPEIRLDFDPPVPCYKMAHEVPRWDAKTVWPKSARRILEGG